MEISNKKLHDFNSYLIESNVAVIGIGVSNTPLIKYLVDIGAKVTVFDNRTEDSLGKDIVEHLRELKVELYLGSEYLTGLIGFDIIFRAPSVRPDLPEILRELQRGAILTSEIEMVLELCPGTVIGVTGSDGKTTTTTLIYELLKSQGYNCYLGGNIGIPLFTKLSEISEQDFVVLELSSFQLMTSTTSPDIAVITNITPNHLDVHKSYEEYIESKKNIFKNQDKNGILVLNYDDEITKELEKEAKGAVKFFSINEKISNGVILENNIIKLCENRVRKHVLNVKNTVLKGKHNYANIATALSAVGHLVSIENAVETIENFKGVSHRLELVRTLHGVAYYNDSIGTSPTRTISGLYAFDKKVILIAGGYYKNIDYTLIGKPIVEKVKYLILIKSPTSERIANAVETELTIQNKSLDILECNSMEQAVKIANRLAKMGDIVLLSPASASFDMYKNFEERGNDFKNLVCLLEE